MATAVDQLREDMYVWDYMCIAGTMLFLPPYLVWKLIMKPFTSHTRRKTWRRFLGDAASHYFVSMHIKRLVFLTGTTQLVYTAWANWYNLPVTITEVGNDARLLWIGSKRTNKVILYLHGGGYVAPLQYFSASFWCHVQQELERRSVNVGIAILNYSLIPSQPFPTQIRQAVSGVEYLISNGTLPENIQIVGDSAGGNLALALLSHILHPLDNIPPVTASKPFKGMYMMSPWVELSADTGSHFSNNATDVICQPQIKTLGDVVLAGLSKSLTPYVQPSLAPEGWFNGAHAHVERFLITAGEKECFYEDVRDFARSFMKQNGETQFFGQPDGVHNDPYFDFLVSEPKLSPLTPVIINWLAEGFS